MPTTQPSPVTPLIPAGEHFLTLAAVEIKEVDNMKFIRGDRTAPPKVNKWLWRFVSDDVDPENPEVHYELAYWTFANYGHPKANLTILLDMIVPKATPEQKSNLDTDRLIGRRYKAQVVHALNDKKEMAAKAAFIVPTDVPAPQRAEGLDFSQLPKREKQTIGAGDVASLSDVVGAPEGNVGETPI